MKDVEDVIAKIGALKLELAELEAAPIQQIAPRGVDVMYVIKNELRRQIEVYEALRDRCLAS